MFDFHTDLTKRVRRPKGPKAISQIARRFARACRPCRRREMSVGCDGCRFIGIKECSLLLIAAGWQTRV